MTTVGRGDLVTKTRQVYSFLQRAGDPAHALELFSVFGALGGLTIPKSEPEAVYRKSLSQRGKWEPWTTLEGPPGDLPTTSFTERMPRATATLLEELHNADRLFTVHTIISESSDPTDSTKWESREVIAGLKLSNLSRDDTEAEEDAEIQFSADASFYNYTRLFKMFFGGKADTVITKEIVGVVVNPPDYRGDKDIKAIYAVQKVDATAPKLIYSLDGGATWAAQALTAMSTNEPSGIAVVGDYIIIVSSAGEAYYYAVKSDLTTWTEVTGGFVSAKGPTAIYAPGVGEIWMCGLGGYLYKLNIPGQAVTVVDAGNLTTQNLNAISGAGNTIVVVGASNAVLRSQNRGLSFAAVTGPEVGIALNCVAVLDNNMFWIGGAVLSYTLDGGATWVASATGIAGLTVVKSIVFCPDQPAVGYVAGTGTGPAGVVKRTVDHGASWESYSIDAPPSNEAINALAVGGPNYLVAGGLVTAAGADGMLGLAAS